jgi:hypothetical protein
MNMPMPANDPVSVAFCAAAAQLSEEDARSLSRELQEAGMSVAETEPTIRDLLVTAGSTAVGSPAHSGQLAFARAQFARCSAATQRKAVNLLCPIALRYPSVPIRALGQDDFAALAPFIESLERMEQARGESTT